ncbi:hypothetical protein [Amycolatopsis sp. NPDC051102]|uniref:hypothetical protein n=1 Tax=Amycolatopsis sp. NPDC051102 TaxID=3155163 RepID=UPI0034224C6B
MARYFLLRRDNVGSSGYVRSWTDSLVWHHLGHSTDIALWLLGVEAVDGLRVASLAAEPDPQRGTVMDVTLVVRTASNQLATIAGSYNNDSGQVYDYLLSGEGSSYGVANGVVRRGSEIVFDERRDLNGDDEDRLLHDREFFTSVYEGRPAAVGADAVLPAMWVLQQVDKACVR